jgi:hypothetical protein
VGRIWFPGGQSGNEVYFREREILAGVGLQARELRIDLWLVGVSLVVGVIDQLIDVRSLSDPGEIISAFLPPIMLSVALLIAAIRRPRTGRF